MSSKKIKPEICPDILVLYVIDMSGSMGGREQAVCDGFNAFIDEQKNIKGECLVSVVMFDTEFDVRCVAQDANTLPSMNQVEGKLRYFVRGGTALRDAVGVTIQGGEAWLKDHPDFKGHVLLVISTDGDENSSRKFQPSDIRAMIETKKGEGWVIVFQGGGESWIQAADMGIQPEYVQPFANTFAGTQQVYVANSVSTSNLRSMGSYTQNP